MSPSTPISQLKKDALEALTADVSEDLLMSISPSPSNPLQLESVNDFEICRQDKERGVPTGTYTVLDTGRQVREHGLLAWETLFIQFRNPDTGVLSFTIVFCCSDNVFRRTSPSHSHFADHR